MKVMSVVLLALLAACTPEAVIIAVVEDEVVEEVTDHLIPEIKEVAQKEWAQHTEPEKSDE